MNSEGKLVFIPESKWEGEWGESGSSKSGNKLYTRLINAVNKLYSYREDRGIIKPDKRIVEYKLVPTGNVYNSKGEHIE